MHSLCPFAPIALSTYPLQLTNQETILDEGKYYENAEFFSILF